jgi:hypothetical protein
MRYQRIEVIEVIELGTLNQCPSCGHHFGDHNSYVSESVRLGTPINPALDDLCVVCGFEAEAIGLIED